MKKEGMQGLAGKLWYGVGAVGLDLSYGMFYSFLNKYLTDVLKLGANFLLILTPLARIWDGINDPLMGSIVDNTHTKMGKYRPWILRGSLLNALVLAFLFNNPGIPTTGFWIYLYISVLYIGWGMSNTLADIPYWSMVPSFTSDPKERSIIATVARTFSGLGQGIVSIGAPILMKMVSVTTAGDEHVWDARSFSFISIGCAVGLVLFTGISVLKTKETVVTAPKEKFSFGKIIKVARGNDQLLIFMLFAMLSNAGFYMISGVGVYFFDVVIGNAGLQGMFNTFGAVGSILGLAVIPIGMKLTSRRRIYQFSLGLAAFGYFGMLLGAKLFVSNLIVLYLFNLVSQVGTAAMFVSQTVFLADIVDYGEVKMGFRAESVTFSMKGFLQKMAYTVQTVILYAGMFLTGYDGDLHAANSPAVKTAFSLMMLVIPALFMLASLLLYTLKFKLHGKYMEDITAQVTAAKAQRLAAAGGEVDE